MSNEQHRADTTAIRSVFVFVGILESAGSSRRSSASSPPMLPKTLLEKADSGLELNGELVTHTQRHPPVIEESPLSPGSEQSCYFRDRFAGTSWECWTGRARKATYTVLVLYEEGATSESGDLSTLNIESATRNELHVERDRLIMRRYWLRIKWMLMRTASGYCGLVIRCRRLTEPSRFLVGGVVLLVPLSVGVACFISVDLINDDWTTSLSAALVTAVSLQVTLIAMLVVPRTAFVHSWRERALGCAKKLSERIHLCKQEAARLDLAFQEKRKVEETERAKRQRVERERTTGEVSIPVVVPGGECFVATAVYGGADHEQVETLRRFRDRVLRRSRPGRWSISAYYRIGPFVARWVTGRPRLRAVFRTLFDRLLLPGARWWMGEKTL
jgi:hypothetical protein